MFIFEWDEAKTSANFRKHRVTFEVAVEAFFDLHSVNGLIGTWSTAKRA